MSHVTCSSLALLFRWSYPRCAVDLTVSAALIGCPLIQVHTAFCWPIVRICEVKQWSHFPAPHLDTRCAELWHSWGMSTIHQSISRDATHVYFRCIVSTCFTQRFGLCVWSHSSHMSVVRLPLAWFCWNVIFLMLLTLIVIPFCFIFYLFMGSQDVAFLHSRSGFFTTFRKNCGRGENLQTAHVIKLWLRVSKGMLSIKYFCSNIAFSLCQSYFMEIIRLLQRWCELWPPYVFGILPDLRQWCLSVLLFKVTVPSNHVHFQLGVFLFLSVLKCARNNW